MAEDRNPNAYPLGLEGGLWQPPSGVAEDRNTSSDVIRTSVTEVAATLRGG